METSQSGDAYCLSPEPVAQSRFTADPEIVIMVYRSPRNPIIPMLDSRNLLFPDEYVTTPNG